jgi:hypothetical protein
LRLQQPPAQRSRIQIDRRHENFLGTRFSNRWFFVVQPSSDTPHGDSDCANLPIRFEMAIHFQNTFDCERNRLTGVHRATSGNEPIAHRLACPDPAYADEVQICFGRYTDRFAHSNRGDSGTVLLRGFAGIRVNLVIPLQPITKFTMFGEQEPINDGDADIAALDATCVQSQNLVARVHRLWCRPTAICA